MKKKNQLFQHSLLVGIVAVVAVVALVLNGSGGIDGAQSYKKQVKDKQLPCLDTDATQNFYVKGKVHVRNTEWTDYCTDGKLLHQFKCGSAGSVRLAGNIECPNNKPCENGACLR